MGTEDRKTAPKKANTANTHGFDSRNIDHERIAHVVALQDKAAEGYRPLYGKRRHP